LAAMHGMAGAYVQFVRVRMSGKALEHLIAD
jgi:hypothetical protein